MSKWRTRSSSGGADDSEVVRSRSGDRFTIDEWSGEEDGTRYVVHATHHDGVAFLHIGTKRNDALAELIESMRIGDDLDDVKPPRLRVRTAKRGDAWNEDLAHLNGFDFPSGIPAGVMLKVRVP